MPGTEYRYTIVLDGQQAIQAAQDFKTQFQNELSQLQVTAQVNVQGIQQQLQQAGQGTQQQVARQAQQAFMKQWGTTLNQFEREFRGVAPDAMLGSLQGYFQQTVSEPAQGAIDRLRGVQQEIGRATHNLKRMGVTAQDWMQAGSIERFGMAIQAAQRRWWGVRGAGYQVQSMGRGMMMAGAAGVGAGGAAMAKYVQYTEPLGRAARNLELNAEMTAHLDEKLRTLAGTVSVFSPEDQAQQLYLWAAATGEVVNSTDELNVLLDRTNQVQKLSHLGMVDQAQAVEAVTDVMSQYQMNTEDTTKIVATLVKVAATSKAEVSDLAMAFRYAGVGAAAANTSFEETAATLQILSAFGLRGSRAGRGLARLMENLIAPSDEAKKHLDALFEDAFGRTDVLQTAEGQFVGLAKAIEILADATANLTEIERAEFVARTTTQNAARVLLPLLQAELEGRRRNIDVIQAQTNILNGHAGQHEMAYKQMMEDIFGYEVSTKSAIDTLNDQWDQFTQSTDGRAKRIKALMEGAIASIGAAVTEMALPMLEDLARLMSKIGDFAREYPVGVQALVGLAGGIAAVGALTVAVGKLITLYADFRMLATATQMYSQTAATMQVHAGEIMMASAMEMIIAAEIYSGATMQQAVAAATTQRAAWTTAAGTAAGAAGGGLMAGVAGFMAKAVPVAIAAIIGKVILDAFSQALTDRKFLDLMSTGREREEAATEAALEVGAMTRDEVEALLEKAEREREAFERMLRDANLLGFVQTGEGPRGPTGTLQIGGRWGRVPEQYQTPLGPSTKMIEHDLAEAEGQVESYEARLRELEKAERGVWYTAMRQAEAHQRSKEAMRQAEYQAVMQAQGMATLAMQEAVATREAQEANTQRIINNAVMAQSRALVSGQIGDLIQLANALGIATEEIDLLNMEMYELVQLIGPAGLQVDALAEAFKGLQASVPTESELAQQAGQTGQAGKQMFLGMADVWGFQRVMEGMEDYLTGLEDLYRRADVEDWTQDRIDYEVAAYEEIYRADLAQFRDNLAEKDRLQKQFVQDQKKLLEDAQKGFEGLISAALKPTEVTAEDLLATEAGVYQDKWDEPARQMRAAMYDPASEFHDLIPPEVWAAGPEAAQAFGQQWLDDFYAGMMPDAINWEAFVDDFMRNLRQEAGRGDLIERAKKELLEQEGITATDEQVLKALGLESPMQQMFFGGLGPTGAGQALQLGIQDAMAQVSFSEEMAEGPAKSFSTVMTSGITTQLAEIDWGLKMYNAWESSFSDNEEKIRGLGGKWWTLVYEGMEDAVDQSALVATIVAIVLQQINDAIDAPPSSNTGGGGKRM
jgi:TP901 family phage tail tape measure protein